MRSISCEKLNARELRIVTLLNAGATIEAIAKRLGYTQKTTRVYVKRLYGRFGVHDRYTMILEARRRGVVPANGNARPRWLTPLRMRHLKLAQRD